METQLANPCSTTVVKGLYVYCIVPGREETSLGPIGLENCEVYTLEVGGMSAIVHECPARPYGSDDRATVEGWVLAHDRVVNTAWARFGSILPMSFDTIIRPMENASARENLAKWLEEKEEAFARQLAFLEGKAEYAVEVSWDPKVIALEVVNESPNLKELECQIRSMPSGLAYIYRARLEKTLKEEMERRATEYFTAFYTRIRECVNEVRLERTKRTEGDTRTLLNVSLLAEKGNYKRLGKVLDEIEKIKGIKVRFTGPWPPYSFVSTDGTAIRNESDSK